MISRKQCREREREGERDSDEGGQLSLTFFFSSLHRAYFCQFKRRRREEGIPRGGYTSRGATITQLRGTAVISRDAATDAYNAIMCRLYATIIATADGRGKTAEQARSH